MKGEKGESEPKKRRSRKTQKDGGTKARAEKKREKIPEYKGGKSVVGRGRREKGDGNFTKNAFGGRQQGRGRV